MAKLHELLAIEKNKLTQWTTLYQETLAKFNKEQMFKGFIKSLKMIKECPENDALEKSGMETRDVVSTVNETLTYLFEHWAAYEDVQIKKNTTNQKASASLQVGTTLIENIPVDELMGLENRLASIRDLFKNIPTLDASRDWQPSSVREGVWMTSRPDITTKTEKVITPVVLYEATKEFAAQIDKITRDEVVGTFTTVSFSGAITSLKKSIMLKRIDDLVGEVKKARMRANSVNVIESSIGKILTDYLLEPLTD